ncbi:MAG: hypothetical protein A2Z51_06580 [Deltaproteobacteria bacterium RBG_19FT_COMBO_52_11]|nr:MAG: hypothetical protein A2Z51_06580 [Deltaproteobacteria bacterium RBG_19FT_COMBO_52_11]
MSSWPASLICEGFYQSMEIAKAIVENFAGNGASAQEIAFSIADSPFISGWRTLCGASVAYGTTKGGCNAKQIFFTELGKRIIGGDECAAKQEASGFSQGHRILTNRKDIEN